MDYMQLVTDAWRIIWQRPKLWLLGIPAGFLQCGTPFPPIPNVSNGSFAEFEDAFQQRARGRISLEELARSTTQVSDTVLTAIGQYWLAIVAIFAAFLLFSFVVSVLAVIARGGLLAAATDTATEALSLRAAWRRGAKVLWPLTGLLLLLLLLALPLIALGLAAFLLGLRAFLDALASPETASDAAQWLPVIGLLFLPGMAYSVLLYIIGEYAQRSLVYDGASPWQAVVAGYRLLRRNLGRSLMLWLLWLSINIGMFIAVFGFVIGLILIGLLTLLISSAVHTLAGPGILAALPFVLLVLIVLPMLMVAGGVYQAFGFAYWNLAWQRLQPAPAGAGDAATPASALMTDGDDDSPRPPRTAQ